MPLKLMFCFIFGLFGLLSGIIAAYASMRIMPEFLVIAHVLIALSAGLGLLHYVDRVCTDTEESK